MLLIAGPSRWLLSTGTRRRDLAASQAKKPEAAAPAGAPPPNAEQKELSWDDVEAVDVGDWEPTPDPDDLEYLDGIDDAEIIPPSPRPASPPPPEGEAEPATTARDGQEGPAPAEEPATAHRYTNPDEEPF